MNNKSTNIIIPVGIALLIIALWAIVTTLFSVPEYMFPSPGSIAEEYLHNTPIFFKNLLSTFIESALGFLLGSTVGFVVGVGMAQSKLFSKIALPYVVAANAIPVIALAPIIIIWFGNGLTAKVMVSAFLCFFPLCINAYRGLNEFDQLYSKLFQVYGATPIQFLKKFKLPHATPFLISGLKLNATFSVVGAIVGEFIGSQSGLGFGIVQANYSLNTPRLWGYIIISCLLGLSFYGLVSLFELFLKRKKLVRS